MLQENKSSSDLCKLSCIRAQREKNKLEKMVSDPARERGLQDYRKKLLEHKEVESRLKESKPYNSKNFGTISK